MRDLEIPDVIPSDMEFDSSDGTGRFAWVNHSAGWYRSFSRVALRSLNASCPKAIKRCLPRLNASVSDLVSRTETVEVPGFFGGKRRGVDIEEFADDIAKTPFQTSRHAGIGKQPTRARRFDDYHAAGNGAIVASDVVRQVRQCAAHCRDIVDRYVACNRPISSLDRTHEI